MDSKQTITSKKTNTGKIGFILTFAAPLFVVIPPLILALIPLSIFAWFLFLIPPVLFILSTIYCIHGLTRKRSRKLATTGLLINTSIVIVLFFLLITLTPPGSLPYPLNIYKFKRACPKATFWLDFDREHIGKVQSQSPFIFGSIGAIHFTSSPDTYTSQQLIQYAETNGWKYHVTVPASDFQTFLNPDNEDLTIEELMFRSDITSINPLTFSMKPNDSVLIFETENYLGIPSLIILSKSRHEVRVYYNNQSRPDPASDFSLPQSFYELSINNNEVNNED